MGLFHENKNDAKTLIKQWIVNVERQIVQKIKRIITDSGGEFLNNDLIHYFEELGINYRPNFPYQHEMSGIVA